MIISESSRKVRREQVSANVRERVSIALLYLSFFISLYLSFSLLHPFVSFPFLSFSFVSFSHSAVTPRTFLLSLVLLEGRGCTRLTRRGSLRLRSGSYQTALGPGNSYLAPQIPSAKQNAVSTIRIVSRMEKRHSGLSLFLLSLFSRHLHSCILAFKR